MFILLNFFLNVIQAEDAEVQQNVDKLSELLLSEDAIDGETHIFL